jgi:acyl carrier protein phosphodiesterase
LNFLGHLWLADQTRTSLAGAVLGDWLRGRIPDRFPEELRLGVALHRRVDVMTDSHPAVAATRAGFRPGERRYAGIVLDVAMDHLLARAWDRFSQESLQGFAQRCAEAVEQELGWFQAAGGPSLDSRAFQSMLLSYGSTAGIERALRRTAQRLKKPDGLLQAASHWSDHAARLEPRLPEVLGDLNAASVAFVRDALTAPPELES